MLCKTAIQSDIKVMDFTVLDQSTDSADCFGLFKINMSIVIALRIVHKSEKNILL